MAAGRTPVGTRGGRRAPPGRKRAWANMCPPAAQSVLRETPEMPVDLGEYVRRDAALLEKLGWDEFVKHRRPRSDFSSLDNVDHTARRILKEYKHKGVPVRFATEAWTLERVNEAIARGAHPSCDQAVEFLCEEFVDMIDKRQFIVLPATSAKKLPGLRVLPMGVIPQAGRRARMVADHTFSGVNEETQPIVPVKSIQFGHALEQILREILLADPALGPVKMLKVDLSDGFYRLHLILRDAPKLGLAFPKIDGLPDLVAIPLVLTMGWKNSPPAFSCNARLEEGGVPPPHSLDEAAAEVTPATPDPPPSKIPQVSTTAVPVERDPCLPASGKPLGAVDIFVDDFIALAQEHKATKTKKRGKNFTPALANSRRVRRVLLHAIDDVFRPLEQADGPF